METFFKSSSSTFSSGPIIIPKGSPVYSISEKPKIFVVKELNSNTSKVSMRSRTKDIAKICSAFGGGGHKLAAGAVIKADVETSVQMILEELKK